MGPIGQQSPGKTETAPTRPGSPKMPPRKTWLWFLLILLANFLLSRFLLPSPNALVTVPYTLFKEEVGKGNVQAIHSQGVTITGRFKAAVTYAPDGENRVTSSEKSSTPKSEPSSTSARSPRAPEAPKSVTAFTTILPSFV